MNQDKYFIFLLTCLIHQPLHCSAGHFKVTDQVFMDLSKNHQPLGRIVIGLFGELAPKTVENFKQIASTGINGKTYAGSRFHRIIKRFMIQGGDIVRNNGSGSLSIFGSVFEDENLATEFKISGLVAMANIGTHTNGCQFFITTVPTPWLNGLHTIFGKVVEGQDFVHIIEHEPTDKDDYPYYDITIVNSGLMKISKPFYVSDEPYDLWAWLRASAVPLTMSFSILGLFHWMIKKMEV